MGGEGGQREEGGDGAEATGGFNREIHFQNLATGTKAAVRYSDLGRSRTGRNKDRKLNATCTLTTCAVKGPREPIWGWTVGRKRGRSAEKALGTTPFKDLLEKENSEN